MASAVARITEPSLSEALKDPIVQLIMKRDGVTDESLWPLIEHARQALHELMPEDESDS